MVVYVWKGRPSLSNTGIRTRILCVVPGHLVARRSIVLELERLGGIGESLCLEVLGTQQYCTLK